MNKLMLFFAGVMVACLCVMLLALTALSLVAVYRTLFY